MKKRFVGLGALINQPAYVRKHSSSQRYAARFYRPIIVLTTTLIILLATKQYWQQPSIIPVTLLCFLFLYLVVFGLRMGLLKPGDGREKKFYRPRLQLLRGQVSLLAVATLMLLLSIYNLNDHSLWILFVLATLIISEHNSTRTVILTLLEVALVISGIAYIGWILNGGGSNSWLAFIQSRYDLLYQILGIWLVNFVFHYLVRNIQGRDSAYTQHQEWLNLITEQWTNKGNPQEKRAAVLKCANELTTAQAQLWVLRLSDHALVDLEGNPAPDLIDRIAITATPHIIWRSAENARYGRLYPEVTFQEATPTQPAQLIMPMRGLDDPSRLVGILGLTYQSKQPTEYELLSDFERLKDLANHARLVLIVSTQHEQTEREKRLAARLHTTLNLEEVERRIVNDTVDEYGFDFATLSLVDLNENLVRTVADRQAGWIDDSIHTLYCNDVQSLTIRFCRTHYNDGRLTENLDRRIWRKYKHRLITRIWVPIPNPTDPLQTGQAIGTIEAGFRHSHRKEIPLHLQQQLENYATLAGIALTNARNQRAQEKLTKSLIELHQVSREIRMSTAFYEPYQMIQLVGSQAQKLLRADIVMIYTSDEHAQRLNLAFTVNQEEAILGKTDRLKVSLGEDSFLTRICQQQTVYYSSDVRNDLNLIFITDNGRTIKSQRTFTQRQNIKSFAGVPLIGKGKRSIGLLCINYRRRRRFEKGERQIIELFAEQATLAIEETSQHRHARTIAISQERNNLGTELHHNLSQHLHGLFLNVKAAKVYADRENLEKTRSALNKTQHIAVSSLNAMESMLNHLHGRIQPGLDFETELRGQIEHLEALYQTHVNFYADVQQWVPEQIQFYLLRIAWEALNNAVRHARCENIHIRYATDQTVAELVIQDDGLGFDVQKARETGRYGLSAMNYFAHQLNSQLLIQSQIGRGTHIMLQVELPPQEQYE
ncbi:MAG: GAF domain-containing protein [Chloroflexota bacterium]